MLLIHRNYQRNIWTFCVSTEETEQGCVVWRLFLAISKFCQNLTTFVTSIMTGESETKLSPAYGTTISDRTTSRWKVRPFSKALTFDEQRRRSLSKLTRGSSRDENTWCKEKCLFCGYIYEPKREKYPACGKSCKVSLDRNHFVSKCPHKESKP